MIDRSIRIAIAVAAFAPLALVGCFSEHRVTDLRSSAGSCAVPDTPEVHGSTLVFIRDYAFHPAQVHVRRGGRVTWLNCESTGGLGHTSSADGGEWSSTLIGPGMAFTTVVGDPGTYAYHCQPHPFMTGSVVVE